MAEDDSSSSVEIAIPMINGDTGNPKVEVMVMDDCNDDINPHIEIVEQPQARGFRFRYECEGPSHGGLQGERSEKYRRSFPAIRIRNYNGPAKVFVKLVTAETVPRPHAHKLVGKNCQDGVCVVETKTGGNLSFPNLCIQHVTRRKAADVIEQRILESIRLDKLVKMGNLNAEADFTDDEKRQAKEEAGRSAKDMQLNVVKLCFQAYLKDENGSFNRLLTPVLSTAIYDSKAPGANALKICRMDKYGGCCSGGEEVFLLCEKVQKDDIAVRFVEQNDEGEIVWESFGNFGPFDVHRQYAIVFKTPAYHNQRISRPVSVTIMLQRKSDQETSDPKSFTYYPQTFDKEEIEKKRKKPLPHYPGTGSDGYSGTGGGNGHPNGQLNGSTSFFPPTEGNLPGILDDNSDQASVVDSRNAFKKGKRRIAKNQDLDTDGGNATKPSLPTFINEIPLTNFDVQSSCATQSVFSPYLIPQTQGSVTGPPDQHAFLFQNSNLFPPLPQHSQQFNDYLLPQGNNLQKLHKPQIAPMYAYTKRGGNISATEEYSGRGVLKEIDMVDMTSTAGVDEIDSSVIQSNVGEFIARGCAPMVKGTPVLPKEILSKAKDTVHHGHTLCSSDVSESACAVEVDNVHEAKHNSPDKKDFETVEYVDTECQTLKTESSESPCQTELSLLDKLFDNENGSSKDDLIIDDTSGKSLGTTVKKDIAVQTEKDSVIRTAERTVKALQLYASTGDIRQVLVVQRYLTSICDDNGDLPLHTSIINRQIEVTHSLLDVMATLPNAWMKVNSYNNILQTPLHLAVLTKQANIVDRLICSGANPTLPDRHGNTAVHLAVQFEANECLRTLLKYQRPKVSKCVPFPEVLVKNFAGFTPLHLAAQKGNLEALKCLVRAKADINAADGKTGRTALHHAVEADDLSITGYLILEAGCSINTQCFNGCTALHIACGRQNLGMVALLMAAGADKNIENSEMVVGVEGDDSESDDDQRNDMTKPSQKGHKPQDYVLDNEKILGVLHGKSYEGNSVKGYQEGSTCHSITGNLTSLPTGAGQQTESGLSSIGCSEQDGDIDQLVYPLRVQLSKLLDPIKSGHDWLELAERLGLRRAIEGQHRGFSPTRLLLTYYESCGGTIDRLLHALRDIGRHDAINVILDFLRNNESPYHRRRIQMDTRINSGLHMQQMTAS